MYSFVSFTQKTDTNKGYSLPNFRDGVSRCGLLVSSLYAIEQLKVDQEVDVFRAVKQVRIPRQQFIQDIVSMSLQAYRMLHNISHFPTTKV